MKKVIGYCRVSSEIQKLKDNSINNQKEYIKDYCERYGYELVDICVDEGISGLKNNRDGLNNLMDRVNKKECDVVVVYSLSRFGRKLKDIITWIELLNKNNVEFISIKENFNNNDVIGKLMLNILGSINEFEVNLLGDRIKDVKRYKKSKNEIYTKDILFGMYKRGKKLVKNPYEIKTLKLIKELREVKKWSYGRISN